MDRIEYCQTERACGRKYQSLANELGVSRQRIHQICKRPPRVFVREHQCIYPGLRKALNDGRINITKLAVICECSRYQVSHVLEGKTKRISKNMIDKLIALTGMTYEELFKEDELP